MQIDPIAAQPRVLRHVFHSARSFDNDGLLVFNPDRFAVPASVCFNEAGGSGGDGGAGGTGGEGGQKPAKTYTQAEFDAQMANARRAFERDAEKKLAEAMATTRSELDELKVKLEESGKSATEKERLAAERARTTAETKIAEQAKLLAEREASLAASVTELRDTRLGHELDGLFVKAKVLPEAMRAARLVFLSDTKFEYDAEGKVAGVDVGTKRFSNVGEAVSDWMKTNGSIYVAAPPGGAGTKVGNAGAGSRSYENMSRSEIAALVDASETGAKR